MILMEALIFTQNEECFLVLNPKMSEVTLPTLWYSPTLLFI